MIANKAMHYVQITFLSLLLCFNTHASGMSNKSKAFLFGTGVVATAVLGYYMLCSAVDHSESAKALEQVSEKLDEVNGSAERVGTTLQGARSTAQDIDTGQETIQNQFELLKQRTEEKKSEQLEQVSQVSQELNDLNKQGLTQGKELDAIAAQTEETHDKLTMLDQQNEEYQKAVDKGASNIGNAIKATNATISDLQKNADQAGKSLSETGQLLHHTACLVQETKSDIKIVVKAVDNLQKKIHEQNESNNQKQKERQDTLNKMIKESEEKLEECTKHLDGFVLSISEQLKSNISNSDEIQTTLECEIKQAYEQQKEFTKKLSNFSIIEREQRTILLASFSDFSAQVTEFHKRLAAYAEHYKTQVDSINNKFDQCDAAIESVKKKVTKAYQKEQKNFIIELNALVAIEKISIPSSLLPTDNKNKVFGCSLVVLNSMPVSAQAVEGVRSIS